MASFDLKLQRAREHLQALEGDAKIWIESDPYAIVDEPDPNPAPEQKLYIGGKHRRFRISRIDPIPKRFGLLIGDCLQCLRSALDHLALSLAMAHTSNMTDRQIESSEFPIFYGRAMKPDEILRKIGCINPAAQALIQALQPHLRGRTYKADPLWQLHEFNRIDKHRTLTVCTAMPRKGDGLYVGFKAGNKEEDNLASIPYFDCRPGELKIDAVFARYTALPIDPNRGVKMNPILPI